MSCLNEICSRGSQHSSLCENCQNACTNQKVLGTIALVVAVVMIVMGLIIAAGVFGGGNMYYLSAGLLLASIISFSLGFFNACFLPRNSPHQ